jgi:hypothetical protein
MNATISGNLIATATDAAQAVVQVKGQTTQTIDAAAGQSTPISVTLNEGDDLKLKSKHGSISGTGTLDNTAGAGIAQAQQRHGNQAPTVLASAGPGVGGVTFSFSASSEGDFITVEAA